jgi:hypothetical protein
MKDLYIVSKVVRIRARSFSRVNAGREGVKRGRRALREVVGRALVVLRPMPTTKS